MLKEKALKLSNNKLIYATGFYNYEITENYESFAKIIEAHKDPMLYEYTDTSMHINLFFDVESYLGSELFENPLNDLLKILKPKTDMFDTKIIVMKSHSDLKRSYHVILKMCDRQTRKEIVFKNILELKKIYSQLKLDRFVNTTGIDKKTQKIVQKKSNVYDAKVFRDGLFRTYLSSKDEHPRRPLIQDEMYDHFSILETFVGYHNKSNYSVITAEQFLGLGTQKPNPFFFWWFVCS